MPVSEEERDGGEGDGRRLAWKAGSILEMIKYSWRLQLLLVWIKSGDTSPPPPPPRRPESSHLCFHKVPVKIPASLIHGRVHRGGVDPDVSIKAAAPLATGAIHMLTSVSSGSFSKVDGSGCCWGGGAGCYRTVLAGDAEALPDVPVTIQTGPPLLTLLHSAPVNKS